MKRRMFVVVLISLAFFSACGREGSLDMNERANELAHAMGTQLELFTQHESLSRHEYFRNNSHFIENRRTLDDMDRTIGAMCRIFREHEDKKWQPIMNEACDAYGEDLGFSREPRRYINAIRILENAWTEK